MKISVALHYSPGGTPSLTVLKRPNCKLAQTITAIRMERHLQRLLPTLCVMRHGLGVSLDSLADSAKNTLTAKHLTRINLPGYVPFYRPRESDVIWR